LVLDFLSNLHFYRGGAFWIHSYHLLSVLSSLGSAREIKSPQVLRK